VDAQYRSARGIVLLLAVSIGMVGMMEDMHRGCVCSSRT
jgi:hypothetical protein